MKFKNIIEWVREKGKWLVIGAVALGVVVGEIETGTGSQLIQIAKEEWESPEMSSGAVAIRDVLMCSVNIRCSHRVPPEGSGSGTILHKYGRTYVLTAAHVVECETSRASNRTDKVYFEVYQGTNTWKAYVVSYSRAHDLALLRVMSTNLVGRSAKFFNPQRAAPIGTKLLHVGNLVGSYPNSYSEGVLAAVGLLQPPSQQVRLPNSPSVYFDQTTVGAWPGSSGGGVFTADGRYVGMLLAGVGPGLNFICPVRRMYTWADENDLLWLFH